MKRMIDNKEYDTLKNDVSDVKSHYVKSVVEYEDESNNKYSTQFYRKDKYLNMYVSKNNETRYIIQAHGDNGIELTYQQKTGSSWQDNPITKKLTFDSTGAKIDGKSISTERLFKTTTDATEDGGVYTLDVSGLTGVEVNDFILYVNSGVATTLYQVESITESTATLSLLASFGGGSKLYQHNITFYNTSSTEFRLRVHLQIINDSNVSINDYAKLATWLYNNGFVDNNVNYICNGYFDARNSGVDGWIDGIYSNNGTNVYIHKFTTDNVGTNEQLISSISATFSDTIIEL